MRKFNVGDEVKIIAKVDDDHEIGDIGKIIRLPPRCPCDYVVAVPGKSDNGWYDEDELEAAKRDLHHLRSGDILLDDDGDERKVIDVLPNSVLLSVYGDGNDLDTAGSWFTPGELKRDGMTLKQDTPAEVTELTLEDIAKLKGVDVSHIKIVEK